MADIGIGSVIDGRYLIEKKLGEGGMGAVYAVKHTETSRLCALKVISNPEMIANKGVVARFQREARAAGAIDTQYITQVLDAGTDKETDLPYIVLEYMKGEDLNDLLKKTGPLATDLALRVIAQSCLGLKKAHDESVVHRDIKPHNLFLTERDAGEIIIKILDFGIAKVKMEEQQKPDDAALTKEGSLLGSPLYVSPEQARGLKDIDHRTDIWSLGACLYQMLTGKTPFGHASALGELILMICTEDPAPLQQYAEWVEPEVATIVHKCLQKDPGERYQSAQELFDAIKELLPNGWAIHQDMLVSIEDAAKTQIAEKLTNIPTSLPRTRAGQTHAVTRVRGGPDAEDHISTVAMDGAAITADGTGGKGGSKVGIALGAIALLGVGGGVFAFTQGGETTAAPAQTVAAVVAPPPPPAAPTEDPNKPKRVQVGLVGPDDLKAEVAEAGGEPKEVKVKNAMIWLEGSVGDIFEVRIWKGTNTEASGNIAITKSGAFPAIIKLEEGKKVVFEGNKVKPAKPVETSPIFKTKPMHKDIRTDTSEFD